MITFTTETYGNNGDISDSDCFYVWDNKAYKYRLTPLGKIVCPECGERWRDQPPHDANMWFDYNESIGGEFLQCTCGEQFTRTID